MYIFRTLYRYGETILLVCVSGAFEDLDSYSFHVVREDGEIGEKQINTTLAEYFKPVLLDLLNE